MSYVVGQLSPTQVSVAGHYLVSGYSQTASFTGSRSASTAFALDFSWAAPADSVLTGAWLELTVPGAANPAVASSTTTSIGTYTIRHEGYYQQVGFQEYGCGPYGAFTCYQPIYQWVDPWYSGASGWPGSATFTAASAVQIDPLQAGGATMAAPGEGTAVIDLFGAVGPELHSFAVTGLSTLQLTPTVGSYGHSATIDYAVSTSAAPQVTGLLTLQYESATPEPGTLFLLGLPLAAILMVRHRQR